MEPYWTMVVSKIILYVLVLNCVIVYGDRECFDCVSVRSCENALELAKSKHDASTEEKMRNAFCGWLSINGKSQPKVCCSDFSSVNLASRSFEEMMKGITNEPTSTSPISIVNKNNFDKNTPLDDKSKLLPGNCGNIDGRRVVGGHVPFLYEFPWMVLISYYLRRFDTQEFNCAGTIISSRYVLTAAHCVIPEKEILGVRIGDFDYNTQKDCQGLGAARICEDHIQDIKIEKRIIHEDFQRNHVRENDIALLRLVEPIDFSFLNVAPVCLPVTKELRDAVVVGKTAVVAGWGLTEYRRATTVLLKVELPIKTECTNSIRNILCAGALNKDACDGDSGGPLMLESDDFRIIQYGIVSYGARDCGQDNQGVYTDVSKYMDWILEHIEP